ncbi:hypothetical protein EDB80DRAFT_708770 [Ilyonectria destructans]|nr:hypothetical protein EDB80DRAFT_708770 [Ilyonectria destructans]
MTGNPANSAFQTHLVATGLLTDSTRRSPLPASSPATRAPSYLLLYTLSIVVAFAIIQEPNQHIGEWIWEKFIPEALPNGSFQAKPGPSLVGQV